MQIVYHPDGSYSQISTPNLKKLSINYLDWYCPIHTFIWLIRWDGTIKSGVCGQNMFYNHENPFWAAIPQKNITNSFCQARRGACGCGSDLNSPKAISQEVYKDFSKKIIDLGTEGVRNIPLYEGKEIIATGVAHKIINSTAEIHIDVGKKCNFDCSYCPSTVHDNYSPFMQLKHINKALKIVEYHSGVLENKHCVITGGEPTLYKDLEDLLNLLNHNNFKKITINTNGTASHKIYTTLLQEAKVNLDITFHYEFTTEKIIKKCTKLKNDFPKQVKLKVLSKSEEFVKMVDISTSDYEQYPIYDKSQSKQVLL